MTLTEKVDVLDFLISLLKTHEKTLDELAHRFEKLLEIMHAEVKLLADTE